MSQISTAPGTPVVVVGFDMPLLAAGEVPDQNSHRLHPRRHCDRLLLHGAGMDLRRHPDRHPSHQPIALKFDRGSGGVDPQTTVFVSGRVPHVRLSVHRPKTESFKCFHSMHQVSCPGLRLLTTQANPCILVGRRPSRQTGRKKRTTTSRC
jgi:hypothetical protein